MPRCADVTCGRWRPDLTSLKGVAGSIRRVGALQFNGHWYCSRHCVEQAARARLNEDTSRTQLSTALPPLRLGVLLRHAGAITQSELDAALAMTGRTGLRIGEQLERLGFTTEEEVLRALATQAGASYLATFDITRVERGPVSLPAATVRALGLIPFEADGALRRLSVICAAPVPRSAVRALIRLTGWAPDVYLVSDRVFQAAHAAYKPAEHAHASHHALTVENVTAAAAHVADLAANERAVTMRHADCNSYRWVRVQTARQISDVLVASTREERGCQVALTAH